VNEEELFYSKNKDTVQEIKANIPTYKKETMLSDIRDVIGSPDGVLKSREIIEGKIDEFEKLKSEILEDEGKMNISSDYSSKDQEALLKRKQSVLSDLDFIKSINQSIVND
jgi:hypothetical protein